MPAYLVAVYKHATRESAERAETMCAPEHGCDSADIDIHDTPPVVLGGLVRGGEYATLRQWNGEANTGEVLCIGSNGRIIDDFAPAACVESALPITWYTYPEEP